MKLTFAVIASILAIAGNLPYVISIFRGVTRPHPFTWFVWTLVSGIVFFGQLARGAGIGALPTLASEIFTLLIFILSLRYGYRDVTRSDVIFLAISIFAIVLWITTNDPTASVTIAVGIDIVAFVPTIRKAAKEP